MYQLRKQQRMLHFSLLSKKMPRRFFGTTNHNLILFSAPTTICCHQKGSGNSSPEEHEKATTKEEGEGPERKKGENEATFSSAMPPSTEMDPNQQFVEENLARAVNAGRMTNQAASHFSSIYQQFQEFGPVIAKTRETLQGQDPERLSAYQRHRYSQVIGARAGELAALSLQKAAKEQQDLKNLVEEGSETGENYWMEGREALLAADIPPAVKDDILGDMQKARPRNSPAFGQGLGIAGWKMPAGNTEGENPYSNNADNKPAGSNAHQ